MVPLPFKRFMLPMVLLLAGIAVSYGSPRPNYQATDVLKNISLPSDLGAWKGESIKEEIDPKLLSYIGDFKIQRYVNAQGTAVYLTLLDAKNFHHPKVCFSGSGYVPQDLADTVLEVSNAQFSAPTIFFKKKNEDALIIYWMCLDKERVNWAGQKMKEFWYSLWGKKRAALIVRLEVPTVEQNIGSSVSVARDLVKMLSRNMAPQQAEYIFGK